MEEDAVDLAKIQAGAAATSLTMDQHEYHRTKLPVSEHQSGHDSDDPGQMVFHFRVDDSR